MRRLIMTRGLPGSGKSYWAEQEQLRLEGQGVKVFVSTKDDIRRALTASGWKWSQDGEKDVIKIQNQQIKDSFEHGTDVAIVADCNFGKHEARLQALAYTCKADFEVKDLTNVALATCVARDAQRPGDLQVGAEVISDMYHKYLARYVPDTTKPKAIIVDLDGTLALHNGKRSPFDYSKVDGDDLNVPIADIVTVFAKHCNYVVLYTSGREDVCRHMTEAWLQKNHLPVDPPHMLIMRKAKDYRKDNVVKQELFDQYIRDNYNVQFVLDDRDQVVSMWRRIGLTCLQVDYGNF